jgi:hypothetical protein
MTHGYRNALGEDRIQVPLFQTGNATLDAILTDWFFGTVAQGGPVTGTLAVTLGALTAAGTGALRISATAASTLGAMTLSSTGTLRVTGSLVQTFGAVTVAGTGLLRIAGSLSQSLGDLTVSATGSLASGILGTVNIEFGELAASATGQLAISATLDVVLGELAAAGHNELLDTPIEVTTEYQSVSIRGSHIPSTAWLAVAGERRPHLRSIFRSHRLQREEDEIRKMTKRAKRRPIDREPK